MAEVRDHVTLHSRRDPTDDAPLSRQLWPADLAAEPFAAVFRKHFAA